MVQSAHKARIYTREALKCMAAFGAIGTVLVLPGSAILLGEFMKVMDKKSARKTYSYLKYRKIISVRDLPDGSVEYRLTSKGIEKYNSIQLDELYIKTPVHWDKKWRMVMFDIPAGDKNDTKRHYFIERLKQLDFCMLQKSVWIHPFECEKEIGQLLYTLGIEQHVSFLVVEKGNFIEWASEHFTKKGLLV